MQVMTGQGNTQKMRKAGYDNFIKVSAAKELAHEATSDQSNHLQAVIATEQVKAADRIMQLQAERTQKADRVPSQHVLTFGSHHGVHRYKPRLMLVQRNRAQ